MLFTKWKLIILLLLVLLTQSAQGFGSMLVAFSMFFQELKSRFQYVGIFFFLACISTILLYNVQAIPFYQFYKWGYILGFLTSFFHVELNYFPLQLQRISVYIKLLNVLHGQLISNYMKIFLKKVWPFKRP
jgi:hypothetical protein